MFVEYAEGKRLQLWVRDVGAFDGFAVFLDGHLVCEIGDQTTRKFPIERPDGVSSIVVHFAGRDGGVSAIVDVTDETAKVRLEGQEGLRHSYLVKGV